MRNLNNKQKEILRQWVKDNFDKANNVNFSLKSMDWGTYQKLKEINDFETIVQAIENFVVDYSDQLNDKN